MTAKSNSNFYNRIAPVLLVLVVGLSFVVGVLWQRVSDIGEKPATTVPVVADDAVAPQAPTSGKLTVEQAEKLPKVNEKDHVRGPRDAQVFLIEYSDFECSFCARFHETAQQALDEYKGKVAWVYRHFPLDSIHPKARPAANASECIAEIAGQEAFWKFTDEVFANPTGLTDLSATAVRLGVNKASFDTCFNEKRHESAVEADYQEGIVVGVTGTPGNFIVNSKGEAWALPGAVPYGMLKQTIDEALAS